MGTIITSLGGELKRIEINDLDAGTFYAVLVIELDGEERMVDSRPSDAIALGVANDVPIYVAEHVIEEATAEHAGVTPAEDGLDQSEESEEEDLDSEEGWA